jgi:regulator of replication initiation timing
MMMKKIYLIIIVLLFFSFANAMSPDEATTFITKTNNFLTTNEVPAILTPTVTIEYDGTSYWIISGLSGTTVNVYIPINTIEKEVATGPVEIRELIKTTIILNRMFEIKNSYPVSDWPVSITNKNSFNTMRSKFNEKIPSFTTIETAFSNVSGGEEIVNNTKSIKTVLEKLSNQSKNIVDIIEDGAQFENNFFANPKTTHVREYQNILENYFDEIDSYKKDFELLQNTISLLRNNIGGFQGDEISSSEKEFYNNIAKLPVETNSLNNIFSRASVIQETTIQIFNSIQNIENFVLNLETRREKNNAWKIIYSTDEDIRKINPNINTLEEAASTILNEDNISFWENQESVKALRANWKQTQQTYNNGVYSSSVEFARSSKKNVLDILKDGFVDFKEEPIDQLIINIIILLIILIVGIFLFEKFYLNKKKNDVIEDDEYEPPQF